MKNKLSKAKKAIKKEPFVGSCYCRLVSSSRGKGGKLVSFFLHFSYRHNFEKL
jgi:hypothetical protein